MEKVRATVDKKPQSAPKVAFLKSTEKRDDKWSTLLVEVGESQDRRAFAELFAHFAPLLKSFAQASRQDGWFPGLAEDLVQEVMIKIWQKAGGYNPQKASATTWIYTVARNCRIDMLRRKCNTQHLPLENEDFWHEPDEETPVSLLRQKRTAVLFCRNKETGVSSSGSCQKSSFSSGRCWVLHLRRNISILQLRATV